VRLFTRADFDGLVCAAILEELDIVDEITYIHPQDLQNNKIRVTENDIIANAPFIAGCGLWFDHHCSEHERLQLEGRYTGASELAPSAAQVVYRYFENKNGYNQRLKRFKELIAKTNIIDSARFTQDDILNPQAYVLLSFLSDPRTGLGLRHTFRTSNLELMKQMPRLLRTKSVDQILSTPDFQQRIQIYFDETERYKQILLENSCIKGHAIVIDFRDVQNPPIGNRFLEYVLHPEQNISIRVADGKNQGVTMISVGHSIINRTSQINVGSLTVRYGGGGHRQVGACQVNCIDADKIVTEIVQLINTK
jgi:oligoribonuclease NrnB/cAMP/cGMP phosphodiesterase (DHH superfamily)